VFNLSGSLLVLNGLIVLLLGFWCGDPLRRSINADAGEETIRAWRVAHSSLVSGGVMLLAISAVLTHLALSQGWQLVVSVLLSVSLYAFSYALISGARTGHRGLSRRGGIGASLVFYANTAGAILSVLAIGLLLIGAFVAVLGNLVN
jgi:hypothetical protein